MKGAYYIPRHTTRWNFINLGVGVQSSTMALMAERGEITPKPDAAIVADTKDEPKKVYQWLEVLKAELSYPVYVVSKGDLMAEQLRLRTYKDGRPGHWAKSLIPAYIQNPDGTRGILGRGCTYDYKMVEVVKKVRELAGIDRGQKEITVTQWFGISWDERQRMKNSNVEWSQHRWPLVELGMTRQDCLRWMDKNGYPTPPRSACKKCPFHSDAEWARMKAEDPDEFAEAVRYDYDLREVKSKTDNMTGIPYLHGSLKPLDHVNFSTAEEKGQMSLIEGFQNECEGMCGV